MSKHLTKFFTLFLAMLMTISTGIANNASLGIDCDNLTITATSSGVSINGNMRSVEYANHTNWQYQSHCNNNCGSSTQINLPAGTYRIKVFRQDYSTCEQDVTVGGTPPITTCDLLTTTTFPSDLCSSCLTEVAVYEYQGKSYLVYFPNNITCADGATQVLDCETGNTLCIDGGLAGLNQCNSFFASATKVQTVVEEDCTQPPVTGGSNCDNLTITATANGVSVNGSMRSVEYANHANWQYQSHCNNNCENSTQINLSAGTYRIKVFRQDYSVCEKDITVTDEGVCTCPSEYAPVCGADGITYDNACLAQCAGTTVASTGECDNGGGNGSNCDNLIISPINGGVSIVGSMRAVEYANQANWQYQSHCNNTCGNSTQINLPPGTYRIKVFRQDYSVCEKDITVTGNPIQDLCSNISVSGGLREIVIRDERFFGPNIDPELLVLTGVEYYNIATGVGGIAPECFQSICYPNLNIPVEFENGNNSFNVKVYFQNGPYCEYQVDVIAIEDCVCVEEYAPVCGANNVTYENACLAECAGTTVVRNQPCDIDPPGQGCDNVFVIFGDFNIVIETLGGGKPYSIQYYDADWQGGYLCNNGDCTTRETLPVLGPDFYTIKVVLEDTWDFCEYEDRIYVPCQGRYSPICGVDGITYDNSCSLERAGVEGAYAGECNNLQDIATGRSAEFTEFNAFQENRIIDLEWITSSSYRSTEYIIEKSTNGMDFSELIKMEDEAQSFDPTYFQGEDNQPSLGTNYYRLKQVFKDGKYKISDIRAIDFNIDLQAIDIYPNPSESEVFLNLKNFAGQKGHLLISNQFGNIVEERLMESIPSDILSIDLSAYQNGVYFIKIRANHQQLPPQKIVVSKMY